MKKFGIVLLALAVCLAAGCSAAPAANPSAEATQSPATATPAPSAAAGNTVTDIVGNTVAVPGEITKVVSLVPSVTEILYELGAESMLVGVDAYSDYPEAATGLPQVGDFAGVNVEAIVALEPDVVFCSHTLQKETVEQLQDLGLPVISAEARTYEEVPQTVALIGQVVGKPEEAEALNADMAAQEKAVTDKLAGVEKPTVYYVMSFGEYGNWSAGPGSFLYTLMEMAQSAPVTSGSPVAWPEYNLEQLLQDDPDVLLVDSALNLDDLKAAEGYKDLRAIQEGRVYAVDANLISRPGPRLMQGFEQVARALHPDCFE